MAALGQGGFRKIKASHIARHAYRVIVPEPVEGCVEIIFGLSSPMPNDPSSGTAPGINSTVVFRK